MDVVIPIVFPDYKIAVEVQKYKVDVFPWFEFDNFQTPTYKDRVSNLGHAGVLFVEGKTGTTKYYEYGRYDTRQLGIVVKARNLPNAISANGRIDPASLKPALQQLSRLSGQSGRIQGVYIEVNGKFEAMLKHAEFRKSQNANKNRRPYSLVTNSCIHFVKEITERAGVYSPWMVDPRPNSYIGKFRKEFPDLNYHNGILEVESAVAQ